MPAQSNCIDEIDRLIETKLNLEFAIHEKDQHKMRQEHIPELGRDVQTARGELNLCLIEFIRKIV